MNENNATIFIPIRVSSYPCSPYPWLFSQEFPMGLRRTKMDENNVTIFHSYPCFFLSVFSPSVAIFSGVTVK